MVHFVPHFSCKMWPLQCLQSDVKALTTAALNATSQRGFSSPSSLFAVSVLLLIELMAVKNCLSLYSRLTFSPFCGFIRYFLFMLMCTEIGSNNVVMI